MATSGNCTLLQLGLNSPLSASADQRPPLNLAVVVDVSGSMASDGKIDFVRQGLAQMVDQLHDEDQVALITYSDDVAVPFPMAPLRDARDALQDIVRGLRPGGSTTSTPAWSAATRRSSSTTTAAGRTASSCCRTASRPPA